MLIITIPVQLHAVKLELPVKHQAQNGPPPEHQRIDIDASSRLFWNGQPTSAAQLSDSLKRLAEADPQANVWLRTDQSASYAVFAEVLASSRRAGLQHVAVIGSEQFVR
jgi:biopolymer transport protein ExbD